MSEYAQIVTSFERTGDFPLEANYIFSTVEELKSFYSDELQAATLHEGLFKIVETDEDGKQGLYWVVNNDGTLEFQELLAADGWQELVEKVKKLEEESSGEETSIEDLQDKVADLTNALTALAEATISGDDSLKAQIKAIVGTDEDDVLAYLKTLDYGSLTAIDEKLKELVVFLGDTSENLDDKLQALYDSIVGSASEDFNTLKQIEDFILKYKTVTDTRYAMLVDEVNNIETAVGLNADGSYSADTITHFVSSATSVSNAVRTLDQVLYDLISQEIVWHNVE